MPGPSPIRSLTGSGAPAAAAVDPAGSPHPTRVARPHNVLFVITSSDMGGAEHIVRELAGGLPRGEFSPQVCSLRPCGRAAERIAVAGTPVHTLGLSERARVFESLSAVRRLAGCIDAQAVDLVHSFLYRGNVIARLAGRLARRRPIIVSGQHSQGPLGGRPVVLASRWTRGLSHCVVAVSQAVADAALRIEGGSDRRVTIIPNGIDPARFAGGDRERTRSALGLAADAIAVGSIGRLAREKGNHVLIEAVAAALQRGVPVVLLLAGDGPERGPLESLAHGHGIARQVRFLGTVDDVRSLYAALDVFALPSLEEASPTALMEAMASGCAIAAAAVGGVPEIVEHERTALLVAPAAPPALAAALVRLAEDPELRARLGRAARERVSERFTVSLMVERHAELYRRLLRGRGAGSGRASLEENGQ